MKKDKKNKVNPITDATKDALLESLYNYGGRHDYSPEEYEPFENAAPLLAEQGYIKMRPTNTFTTLTMNATGQDMYLSGGFSEVSRKARKEKWMLRIWGIISSVGIAVISRYIVNFLSR